MSAVQIELEDGPTGGRYVVREDGAEAEMTFSKAGETMIIIIDHTGVPEALRHRGIGEAMVERAVADMRGAGKKIMPLCPFAAAQFRKHSEWADVKA